MPQDNLALGLPDSSLSFLAEGTQVEGTITYLSSSDLVVALSRPYRGLEAARHIPFFEAQVNRFAVARALTDYGRSTARNILAELVALARECQKSAERIRRDAEAIDRGYWYRPVELDAGPQPFLYADRARTFSATHAFRDRLEAEIAVLRDSIEWSDLHSGFAQISAVESALGKPVSYDLAASLFAIACLTPDSGESDTLVTAPLLMK